MAAYLVVQASIGDAQRWQAYRAAVMPLLAAFGGRHVASGGPVQLLEGQHDGRALAMFEFPSMDAITAFWNAPEYVPIKALRLHAAVLDVWAVPGV